MKSSSQSVVLAPLLIVLSLRAAIAAPLAQGQVNFSTPPTYAGGPTLFVAHHPSEIGIPYSYPPHSGAAVVQAADMNGDGKPDLIIESPVSTVFVLINSNVSVAGTQFSPSSVTFPSQTVGASSNPAPATLTNTGAVALTVKSVAFGGADAGEFTQTNNCTTVEPLENCTIAVTFAPTATGGSSANLIVTDNAGTGSQQVVVSGTGAAVPGFTVSAAAPSPASVRLR